MLDVKRLIGEVASQNGIRLEADDPAFALVTLNQLVLEETAKRLCDHLSITLAQFTDSLSKGEHLAGRALAQEVKATAIEIRNEWAAEFQSAQPATVPQPVIGSSYFCLAIGALSGAALTAAGFVLYRIMIESWPVDRLAVRMRLFLILLSVFGRKFTLVWLGLMLLLALSMLQMTR